MLFRSNSLDVPSNLDLKVGCDQWGTQDSGGCNDEPVVDFGWGIEDLELPEHGEIERRNVHDRTQPLVLKQVLQTNCNSLLSRKMHQLGQDDGWQPQFGKARLHQAKRRVRSGTQAGRVDEQPE